MIRSLFDTPGSVSSLRAYWKSDGFLPDPAALATAASCQHRSTVTDATVAGRWNLDRFELAGEAGHRMGLGADVMRDSRYWASATMTMWVAPRAAVVAGGGRQPSSPARGIPSRTFGSLGMVLSYLSPSRNSVPRWVSSMNGQNTKRCPGMGRGHRHFTREQIEALRDAKDWPSDPPSSK